MSHKDPEVRRAYAREWNAKNRDKVRGYYRTWARRNPGAQASRTMKQRYGVTHAERDTLLAAQNGACAICEQPNSQRWHVDHCHETSAVRGILCHNCNVGLGHFRDNPTLLQKAATYLSRPKETA